MKFLKTFVKLKTPTIIERSDFAKIMNNRNFLKIPLRYIKVGFRT